MSSNQNTQVIWDGGSIYNLNLKVYKIGSDGESFLCFGKCGPYGRDGLTNPSDFFYITPVISYPSNIPRTYAEVESGYI
jgi:hypothetical protein